MSRTMQQTHGRRLLRHTERPIRRMLRECYTLPSATIRPKYSSHYLMVLGYGLMGSYQGNFRRAATQQQSLAEVYETEIGDQKMALDAYDTAASWFENDGAEACVGS